MSAVAVEITTALQIELCFHMDVLILFVALYSKAPSWDICMSSFTKVGDSEAKWYEFFMGEKKDCVRAKWLVGVK